MKTYVINLECSTMRRRRIVRELERNGLDHEILNAVDGSTFSEQDLEKYADVEAVRRQPEWLTNRMIATVLSHRRVYERIIADEVDYALVLEDDVDLGDGRVPILEHIEPFLDDSEAILLHYMSFAPLQVSTKSAVKLLDGFLLGYPMFLRGVVSAAAYIITRKAAIRMLEQTLPVRTASDDWLWFYESRILDRVRCVYPMLVQVIGAKSTISVATQSGIRARATELIEKYELPFINSILTRRRLRNIATMSKFATTDERSPLEPRKSVAAAAGLGDSSGKSV